MPTNKARTSDYAQKQSASNAIPIFYSDLLFCSLSNKSSSSWSRPCTHHVSSSPPAYIDLILFPYCFRIVSASGSENDRRTIGERYGNDTGSIRDQYGIDTGLIRERYETDTRTVFSDSQPKRLIRSLTFSSSFLLIIFYISITRRSLPFMTRSLAHHLPWCSHYTKITFRPAECKPISTD